VYTIPDQNELRLKLNNYIEINGIKARWFSNQLGIHETRISHFRKGRENLNDKNYYALSNYLIKVQNNKINT